MGVTTTTYYWGFRGADRRTTTALSTPPRLRPPPFHRDLSVYEEVGRRAAIVCGGVPSPVISRPRSTSPLDPAGRLTASEEPASYQEHYDIIKDATNGRLSHEHVSHHASQRVLHGGAAVEAFCAPDYTTDCSSSTRPRRGDIEISGRVVSSSDEPASNEHVARRLGSSHHGRTASSPQIPSR